MDCLVTRLCAYRTTGRSEMILLPGSGRGCRQFTPFILVDGSGPALQQTMARLGYDADCLYVRFDCEDHDIWGTYRERDEPLYDEEVVELFISPGAETPTEYFEFEISPNGVFFDARISNLHEDRTTFARRSGMEC